MAYSILLAEDNPMMRVLARKHLPESDFNVVEVDDGLPALQNLVSGRFDLAILDDVMPNLDGRAVLALMKHMYECGSRYREARGSGLGGPREAVDQALDALKKSAFFLDGKGNVKLADLYTDKLEIPAKPGIAPLSQANFREILEKLMTVEGYAKVPIIITIKKERDGPEYRRHYNLVGPPDGYIVKPDYWILPELIESILEEIHG